MWLSVIVPTFNRAGSLKRLLGSLESLESSDSVQVEVLIVDNGSTDKTPSLLLADSQGPDDFLSGFSRREGGEASASNIALDIFLTYRHICHTLRGEVSNDEKDYGLPGR